MQGRGLLVLFSIGGGLPFAADQLNVFAGVGVGEQQHVLHLGISVPG
jgi:hypothetical protein